MIAQWFCYNSESILLSDVLQIFILLMEEVGRRGGREGGRRGGRGEEGEGKKGGVFL